MSAILILVVGLLAAGPPAEMSSGLKDPFARHRKNPRADAPTVAPSLAYGLKNPFATGDADAPTPVRSTSSDGLKNPFANPAPATAHRPAPRVRKSASSGLLDPFAPPRTSDTGLRDPWAKRPPAVQRPRHPAAQRPHDAR